MRLSTDPQWKQQTAAKITVLGEEVGHGYWAKKRLNVMVGQCAPHHRRRTGAGRRPHPLWMTTAPKNPKETNKTTEA